MSMLRWELQNVMQFRTAIDRYLRINNTFNLSNLMSFTGAGHECRRRSNNRWTVKHKIPLFLDTTCEFRFEKRSRMNGSQDAFASRALTGSNLKTCRTDVIRLAILFFAPWAVELGGHFMTIVFHLSLWWWNERRGWGHNSGRFLKSTWGY